MESKKELLNFNFDNSFSHNLEDFLCLVIQNPQRHLNSFNLIRN